MTDLERVARGIADGFFCKRDVWNRPGYLDDEQKEEFVSYARSALLAIREPSERMVHAGDKQIDQGYRDGGTI